MTCVVGSALLMALSNKLNLMSLDDADAKSLGLDSEQLRLACLVILSFMAASVISYAGIIGFVGLIVPHIVRLLLGADNRFVIPASFIVGDRRICDHPCRCDHSADRFSDLPLPHPEKQKGGVVR